MYGEKYPQIRETENDMNFSVDDFKVLNVSKRESPERIDYGVQMVGAPLEWLETKGGKGIAVGIIDTGAEYTHDELKDAIIENRDFTSCGDDMPTDENGHGTHVAGIIAARENGVGVIGVAPRCDLYIARAFSPDGRADMDDVTRALEWLISKKVHVINMSFSAPQTTKRFRELIRLAYESGITMVCAAGNNGESTNVMGYPARFDECIAVTAVDIDKKHAAFSTRAPKAEVCAAGMNVYSSYLNNGYATLSGTSMATPIISGAVALIQAKAMKRYGRRLTPDEVRLLLHMYAEGLGERGRDASFGYGLFTFDRIYYDTVEKSYISKLMSTRRKEYFTNIDMLCESRARGYKSEARVCDVGGGSDTMMQNKSTDMKNIYLAALLTAFLLEKGM